MLPKLFLKPLYWLTLALEWWCEKAGRIILINGRPGTPEADNVYLVRYYLLPKGSPWQIYIHRFLRSDHDVPHDHPFDFISILLKGGYYEFIMKPSRKRDYEDLKGAFSYHSVYNPEGSILVRQACHIHKVKIDKSYSFEDRKTAPLTLVLRSPRHQEWGFWTTLKFGSVYWTPWKEYLGIEGEDFEEERA